MVNEVVSEAAGLPCRCQGVISNCLFCGGTGVTNTTRAAEAQLLLAKSCVVQCPACNQQNRVSKERLQVAPPLLCSRCQAPLLRHATSLRELLAAHHI